MSHVIADGNAVPVNGFQQRVTDFMQRVEQVGPPTGDVIRLRAQLITEESNELDEALDSEDVAKVAQEIADCMYVLYGTCVTIGYMSTVRINQYPAGSFPFDPRVPGTMRESFALGNWRRHIDALVAELTTDADLIAAIANQPSEVLAGKRDEPDATYRRIGNLGTKIDMAIAATASLAEAIMVDITPIYNLVHDANMLKVDGPVREDGKRLKPTKWKPADVAGEIRRQTVRAGQVRREQQ